MATKKEELCRAIVEKALTEKNSPGFSMMDGLPKTVEKYKKLGIDLKDKQQLRNLITAHDEVPYIVYLCDTTDNKYVWGVWKKSSRKSNIWNSIN
jgi:hypothetical protein